MPQKTPKIIFCVTNDLTYDQRMQRICTSVAQAGFEVVLVGRTLPSSLTLPNFKFTSKRLNCWFAKGFAFYTEYNIRLFFFLLFTKCNCLCAIDLDTIVPVYFVSTLKGCKRVYDAHELFTEQKEIVTRPKVYKVWLAIERFCVPKFKYGYTVNLFIKEELNRRYGVNYEVIRNMPLKVEGQREKVKGVQEELGVGNWQLEIRNQKFLIYQGAVNEGRSFETLIPAMKQVNCKLLICGEGNFFEQTKTLIAQHQLEDKIELKGYVAPAELKKITPQAIMGLTLFEKTGLNQYYSLSNRFFDYIMAGIPQVCVGYPEYKAINDEHHIALLIDNTDENTITQAINTLIENKVLYNELQQNCNKASKLLNWEQEEEKLMVLWQQVLAD